MSTEPTKDEGITSKDILDYKWKEYTLYISHFRYYLEIILKTNVFFYLTTGGVVGYYLTSADKETVKYFFILPILIGTALTTMFIYGANLWRKVYLNSQTVKETIEKVLDTKELPDTHLVYLYLWLSAIMFFIIGLTLAILPYFIGGSSWKYFIFAISLETVGMWIIRSLAQRSDRRLKGERILHCKIKDWEKIIRRKDFDPSSVKKKKFYNDLQPFLGKDICQSIKRGTLTTELLLKDIKRIKAIIFKD